MPRTWDAASYDRIGGPMTAMATPVLDRLVLSGDEYVLDAGCGTGRVTELLLERLARGRVLAVDADPQMVELAKHNLGGRAEVRQCDLLDLVLTDPVDAIFSTATFHWVLDHQKLFDRLFESLVPGGRLVAQCGGDGNIAELRAVSNVVTNEQPFASHFEGWNPPWYYAGVEETTARLEASGFTDIHTWLQPWPITPDDPTEYLATVPLGPQVQRLPAELTEPFLLAVIERLSTPVTVGYVRLNIEATRPH